MTKAVIFDSGTLINLSMNGLLFILEKLKKSSGVKLLITQAVKYEIVDRPIGIPRFELGAIRVKDLINTGVLELSSSMGVSDEAISAKTRELMTSINHFVKLKGKWIEIVSEGEISCLALSSELTKKGMENIIAIDERTTRTIAERPETLEELMSNKMHQRVTVVQSNFEAFKDFKFIRSTEIVYVAYKKGLLEIKDPRVLEAVLYATKYHGAAVSFEEIDVLKKL